MKVLVLSPYPEPILLTLKSNGDEGVVSMDEPEKWPDAEYLISFGYRRIIPQEVLNRFPLSAINIHMSYLPWNRGADPNFWSWYDDTPKGVTIHHMTNQVDHGPIISQGRATDDMFGPHATLKTSWMFLYYLAGEIFDASWPVIRVGGYRAKDVDPRDGSYHTGVDFQRLYEPARRPIDIVGFLDMPIGSIKDLGYKARKNEVSS